MGLVHRITNFNYRFHRSPSDSPRSGSALQAAKTFAANLRDDSQSQIQPSTSSESPDEVLALLKERKSNRDKEVVRQWSQNAQLLDYDNFNEPDTQTREATKDTSPNFQSQLSQSDITGVIEPSQYCTGYRFPRKCKKIVTPPPVTLKISRKRPSTELDSSEAVANKQSKSQSRSLSGKN